jgi:hypothetical protein
MSIQRIAQAYAVAFAAACASLGCDEGSPASPTFEAPSPMGTSTPLDAGAADAGDGAVTYAVCPPDMDASFGSIFSQMLSTQSCGTNVSQGCHSSSGPTATGNLLDYTLDASAVYAELLGDGGGQPAENLSGSAKMHRVVPFDAGASMLYTKLTLKTLSDPQYGAGMPYTAPGSVCPAALDAVKIWIDHGAKP